MKPDNTIDRLFAERLGAHQTPPPSWEKLAQRRQRKPLLPWGLAAAIALLLTAAGWWALSPAVPGAYVVLAPDTVRTAPATVPLPSAVAVAKPSVAVPPASVVAAPASVPDRTPRRVPAPSQLPVPAPSLPARPVADMAMLADTSWPSATPATVAVPQVVATYVPETELPTADEWVIEVRFGQPERPTAAPPRGFWQKLRRLKQGQPLEWEDLGLDRRQLLALVQRKPKEEQ